MPDVEVDPNPIVGTVEVHNSSLPEGYEVFIPGLGIIENGTVREVNAVQLGLFQDAGYAWPDTNKLILKEETVGEESTTDAFQEGTSEESSSQEDAEESHS